MLTKSFLSVANAILLLFLTACAPANSPLLEIVVVSQEDNRETIAVPKTDQPIPMTETIAPENKERVQVAQDSSIPGDTLQFPDAPAMQVILEETTFVRLLSEEYARIQSVCAGVGLSNIKPLPDGPMILIPNAGDLSVYGSNVAVKLNPDGEITFIPRVQGQRIRVPMNLEGKVTGEEVLSLTFNEGLELMAADLLIWTARDQGPYHNGHGLPGHIADCDPRYGQTEPVTEASAPAIVTEDLKLSLKTGLSAPFAYTSEIEVLLEEMTFVQILSEEYARIQSVCAGVGLNNIKPLPDESRILIPNAGDLSVEGSNVAIKLNSDGEIIFIPRTQSQRIRVPMDLGDKVSGEEVLSLSLDEAMQLMAAGKLYWTARDHGPYGNGHGLPGHIAECDPRYIDS